MVDAIGVELGEVPPTGGEGRGGSVKEAAIAPAAAVAPAPPPSSTAEATVRRGPPSADETVAPNPRTLDWRGAKKKGQKKQTG